MLLFALIFLAIYSAMHALVFWGFFPLLSGHRGLPVVISIWMGVMIFAPIMVRILDRNDYQTLARALAWVSYGWMGLLFLAFSLLSVVGIWHILALLLRSFLPSLPMLSLYGPGCAMVVLLAVLATGLYGFYEAANLRVEKLTLFSAKLPAEQGLSVALVSDVHLGLIHQEEALAPIVSRLLELKPDLLVATGDMVDAQMDHLNGLSALWQRVDPPLGKFAVTGNHEYYAGLDQALAFHQRSGFRMLRGEAVTVDGLVTLVGVDDPTGSDKVDEADLLRNTQSGLFTLLLKHRPRFNTESAGLFDLQLSGHAHRGQIFPFNLLTRLEYPLQNGLYDLAGGSRLYTSRGTGTWGPPMRVGSPPEITLFEIVGVGGNQKN